ncbi:hypothetical protein BZA77DRAFT_324744 [Pyronema omphalodes]|nr:hypothetical protein BZA77DRAFT_324744 [Pyronema omphalodes]
MWGTCPETFNLVPQMCAILSVLISLARPTTWTKSSPQYNANDTHIKNRYLFAQASRYSISGRHPNVYPGLSLFWFLLHHFAAA